MPNNDKIYQAYMGQMGERFQTHVKRRLSWIVEQVGDYDPVWDVGCSQGIISILLAQEGRKVTGIDIQPESIEFARNILENEYPELKNNLSFVLADFFEYKSTEKPKCIVITQVLEHLEYPEVFLEVARHYLDEGGKLIITVPFGVNDHPDHFSTFYMYSLYNLVRKFFDISHLEFLGKWMGLVAFSKNSGHQNFEIDDEAIQKEELNFLLVDKDTVDQIETLTVKLKESNEKYRKSIIDYKQLKEWLDERNRSLDQLKSSHQKQIKELKSEYEKIKDLQKELAKALLEDTKLFDNQIDALENIKQFMRKLQTQNSYLKTENQEYRRKFKKITGTWYGRFLLKCYKLLKRVKKRLRLS